MINPYWDEVCGHVHESDLPWERGVKQVNRLLDPEAEVLDRQPYVGKYSWSIPDPDSVVFVARYADGGLIDPMAGTGYWAYLLEQVGVDILCYDLQPGENAWHDGTRWVSIVAMDGEESVREHPDRTLLLAWPPYSEDVGTRILSAYKGNRVIFIGEGEGGCTGDCGLHDLLEDEWQAVVQHTPVQWWGMHDHITVFERR